GEAAAGARRADVPAGEQPDGRADRATDLRPGARARDRYRHGPRLGNPYVVCDLRRDLILPERQLVRRVSENACLDAARPGDRDRKAEYDLLFADVPSAAETRG